MKTCPRCEDEVEKLVREAQSHESEDKRRREEAENRNKLEALVYQVEKTLREHKDKIPSGDASTLEGDVRDARKALEQQDDAAVRSATDKLQTDSNRIISALYQSAGGNPGEPGAGPGPEAPPGEAPKGGKGKDGVIDAEYEESN